MSFLNIDTRHIKKNRFAYASITAREAQSMDGMAQRLWNISQKKDLNKSLKLELIQLIVGIEDILALAGRLKG